MKLSDHVEHIRQLIDTAFRNRLGRMGIAANGLQPANVIPAEYQADRKRIEPIRETLIAEMGTVAAGYEKLVEEFTFTLFNRIAALKVMEAHTLHPEIVTRRSQHGDRSFAHRQWLEEHPAGRNEEMEGLVSFISDEFGKLTSDIPLFSLQHPYHLLPTVIELNGIINAFNAVEADEQVEPDIWKSDDVLGWLYESYNNYKKAAHKDCGAKTEYNKVSIQSQVYTPRWVVKFLVDNSLGKLYLEMFPDSDIKSKYKIANAPKAQTREPKPLTEIKLIDPATGSGNFLLYAFDLFFDLYKDQIENYGADYDDRKIPELIITHNLHGIDLDDRAVQIAQLGLYIKAKRKKRGAKIDHFNIVSSDFFLPDYPAVRDIFEANSDLDEKQRKVIRELWSDLQQAYKFGALIRIEEKLSLHTHALIKQFEGSLFSIVSKETVDEVERFKDNFFANLHRAVATNTERQGRTFLNTKTEDAITYLQLLTQKYDVAVANPPYTDSADFGEELKEFIELNYKKPYKFNSNLYAAFIKRCCEITDESGFVALIHPHTFMFIKTFEDVRKYIIQHTHIDLLVDYGLDRVNLFGPGILLDATWYVLSKRSTDEVGVYFNITGNQQEKAKQKSLEIAYEDALQGQKNDRVFFLPQEKLKVIESWPFIYWISDAFRDKFKQNSFSQVFNIAQGIATADNNRFVRFWWEIAQSFDLNNKWYLYSKGGPYNKWYGNNWAVVNWENDGYEIRNIKDEKGKIRSRTQNEKFYFKKGITYTASGSKGASFRIHPENALFDVGGSCIFPTKSFKNFEYAIALLNSKICFYILDCLNPTVNTQVGDLGRIPFITPSKQQEETISSLASKCILNKIEIDSFRITSTNFSKQPLTYYTDGLARDRLLTYLDYENKLVACNLLYEAVINQLVLDVYELSEDDRMQVMLKMGTPVGSLPVMDDVRTKFLETISSDESIIRSHLMDIPSVTFEEDKVQAIKAEFPAFYQSNNDLEEFCIRHQVNPINVWYWFKESKVVPAGHSAEIGLEFLADAFRTILMEDEDGIVPLVGLPGEPKLIDRLEQYCFSKGFSTAQFMQLDGVIGRPLNEYIEQYFFRNFSDHLNLFMYLPKTPFIWHLSSGEQQGFEAYIIIYKWNRDSLYRLKSSYLNKRTESLNYRLQQIGTSNTAQAQTEKELIRKQLQEIDGFSKKIDELIAEGYDPKLDDGVGKNIAPLQKKGMLKAEVLNKKQLEKYLNADW